MEEELKGSNRCLRGRKRLRRRNTWIRSEINGTRLIKHRLESSSGRLFTITTLGHATLSCTVSWLVAVMILTTQIQLILHQDYSRLMSGEYYKARSNLFPTPRSLEDGLHKITTNSRTWMRPTSVNFQRQENITKPQTCTEAQATNSGRRKLFGGTSMINGMCPNIRHILLDRNRQNDCFCLVD
jgi:hypothetical protein